MTDTQHPVRWPTVLLCLGIAVGMVAGICFMATVNCSSDLNIVKGKISNTSFFAASLLSSTPTRIDLSDLHGSRLRQQQQAATLERVATYQKELRQLEERRQILNRQKGQWITASVLASILAASLIAVGAFFKSARGNAKPQSDPLTEMRIARAKRGRK